MDVRVRMAPSPTGDLHLGTAYGTLWPYLFARHNRGIFILRIEDTDRERSTKQFEDNIISGLKWLGFEWDEGPYHQMDRINLYQKASDKLLKEDKAYLCFCTKEELDQERKVQAANSLPQVYSGKCRNLTTKEAEEKKKAGASYIVRYKLPEGRGQVEFEDLIHGKISFDSKLLGDMVIMRQNGIPLYNFAVVIDDADMRITHVIRGDDHISNTPKQILIFEALGINIPQFVHYPVVLNQDRIGKLSKRTGSTSIEEYKKDGFLPEALLNYLALLGWSPPNDKEIWSLSELIEAFDIKDVNKSPGAWDEQKLEWINGEYIRKMSDEELTKALEEFLVDHPAKERIAPVVPLIKERIKKLSDFVPLTDFLWEAPEYEEEVFQKLNIKNQSEVLKKILGKMEEMKKPWNADIFERTFRKLAEDLGLSATQVFQLIRVAISGQIVTPPLFECIKILGEQEAIKRIERLK